MIDLKDTVLDACVKLSEGNPGAATVCAELLKLDPEMGFIDLCHMDDMGLKGPSIWIGYKDFANCDILKFRDAVRNRSQAMIDAIRAEGYEAFKYGKS